jgi:hypothetical protein
LSGIGILLLLPDWIFEIVKDKIREDKLANIQGPAKISDESQSQEKLTQR